MIYLEEFERLKEDLENKRLELNDVFLDYDDYEDDYSHNEIQENQERFIKTVNEFFKEQNIRMVAVIGCENVRIVELPENEHWNDYDLF